MQKQLFCLFYLFIATSLFTIHAQEATKPKVNLSFNARADGFLVNSNDTLISGFEGKNLNIILNGNINDRFSYRIRQRLNKPISKDLGFFNATDVAYLSYKFNNKFSITAGKQVVAIGGYEYDYAPIDIYFLSHFTKNIPSCYEFGVTGNYSTGTDNFGLQIVNSPFAQDRNGLEGIYAYNFMWMGEHKWFKSLYSVNMIEYTKGKFLNYISLGNQFNLGDFSLELDFLNRTPLDKVTFFEDFSLVANLWYTINNKWRTFAKGGYDQNKTNTILTGTNRYQSVVPVGAEYAFGGAGVEFYPLQNSKDIRLHAFGAATNDKKSSLLFNIGVTWLFKAI